MEGHMLDPVKRALLVLGGCFLLTTAPGIRSAKGEESKGPMKIDLRYDKSTLCITVTNVGDHKLVLDRELVFLTDIQALDNKSEEIKLEHVAAVDKPGEEEIRKRF